jgi:copper chaperone CopZ
MKIELQVMGMSCAHCENRVVKALLAMSGVHHAQAFAAANRVEVEYEESQMSRAALEHTIERLGYRVNRP